MPLATPGENIKDTVHRVLADAEQAANAVIDVGEQAGEFVPVELTSIAARFLAALKSAKGNINPPKPPTP